MILDAPPIEKTLDRYPAGDVRPFSVRAGRELWGE
jgi:hypothetical protein